MIIHNCLDSSFHLTRTNEDGSTTVDAAALVDEQPARIGGMSATLSSVYTQIRQLAPNAQIIVIGYPHVVTTGQLDQLRLDCSLLSPAIASWFAQMTDQMNTVIDTARSQVSNTTFVNPVQAFNTHEACTTGSEWINATIASSSSGSGLSIPGSGSFHPDYDGQVAYRSLISPVLQ